MDKLMRIGMDTSKSVFQLHGVDGNEEPVLRKRLRRKDVLKFFERLAPVQIGMEACGGSQYWGRELRKLGHEVVLIPPQYVKPYVERNKNDAADAEAICEAMSRPKVRKRFVAVKEAGQQACQMLIGLRTSLVRRRTQLSNMIRGHAAEFGLVAAKGLVKIEPLLERVRAEEACPSLARELFAILGQEYVQLQRRIVEVEAKLIALHRCNETSRRLAQVPGIGPITATVLSLKLVDPHAFRSGRDFAAFIGLTPRDHSTAGRTRLGAITRAGDETLRSLLVVGAMAVIRQAKLGRSSSPWLVALLKRKPPKLAAVALANKTARIAWKLMVSGEHYAQARIEAATVKA